MRLLCCATLLAIMTGCAATGTAPKRFTTDTISFGIVVSNIDKALVFYKDAVGLTEVGGFDVPAEMARDAGLSNNKPFHVHVLKTTDVPEATQVKLMQFLDTPGARPDNSFIHSTYGVRYLTIRVADIDAAMARAAKAGVKPIAKGPYRLASGQFLAIVRDPDGNMVELIGPKRSG